MSTTTSPTLDPDRLLKTKPVRWGWKVFGSLFVLVVLAFGTMQTAVMLAHEEYTEVDEFPAAGIDVVEVHNAPGAVRIVASPSASAETIKVTTRVSDGFRDTQHSEGIEGNRLMLEASCPNFLSGFCSVQYTVVTPPDVQVVVRSDASVTVSDIDGLVDVESVDGRVEVARLGGTVRLHTVDGGISATDLRSADVDVSTTDGGIYVDFDRLPTAVRAETTDGSVEIVIPDEDDAVYRVETDTVDGDITSSVRTDPAADRSIVATTTDGSLTVRYG